MLQRIIPFLFVFTSMSVYAQTTVTISSSKTYITEDESLDITATLNGISANDVTVNFTFTGTATSAIDYTTMAGPYTVAGGNGAGSNADQLSAPFGIFLDASGNIYVVDSDNDRIQKWTPGATSGITVAGGNGAGSAANQLDNPSDVFVDVSGNIYIADTDNHRVQMWASGASAGTTVAGGNGQGSALNQLDTPKGIYVDVSANIYVSDWSNHRVQKWLSGATVGVTVAGGNGRGSATNQLDYPAGIYVDNSAVLYVADWYNHRIQKWASGDLVGTTVAGGNSGGSDADQLNYPYDVFVDASNNIYIADAFNHRIQKWDSGAITGTTVAGGHGQGSDVDQFMTPRAVYVDALSKIYVSDQGNNRVQQNQFAPTIVIEAGQISGSLEIAGISDGVSEGDETIIADVNSVLNATLVEPSQQNIYLVCTAAPFGDPTQSVCDSGVVSDLFANGDNIQWYAAASGGSALSSSLALVNSTSYFATQTVDACESLERFEVVVTINSTAAPTGDATQSFINSGTVADLEATGTNIQWYDASSGGSVLGSTTALVDGTSYFATQTLSSCESASRFEVVVTIYTTNTWTGAADNDWGNSANWSSGVVPDAGHNVEIPSGEFPEYSGSGSCHNLTIAAGAGLTLSGTITAGGNVTVESNESTSGSLIFTGSGEIVTSAKRTSAAPASITFERYLTDEEWHMMGSPLNGQTINSVFLTDNSISGMKDYFESEDPSAWNTDYTITAPDVAFSLGKGYATKRSGADIVSLTGTPNTSQVDISLTRVAYGWNLISNPFTSAIAANVIADGSNNLLTINEAVLEASYVGLYIWDQSASSYKVLNHSGGTVGQNYLQVGQGFFVKSADPAGTFSITPAMQSHQPSVAFKSIKEDSWANIVLSLETNDTKASTQISYHETMTRGLDIGYDAGLFNSNSERSLYSRLIEDNGVDFGLQCLPTDYENLIVPLGVNAKAGDMISFSVSATNIPEDYALILEDKWLGEYIDLSDENKKYTILLSDGLDGLGRFYLHTRFKDALSLDNLDTESNYQIFSRADLNQIVIRGVFSSNATARIYSIAGKLLAIINLSQAVENTLPFNEETGVYIIQITDSESIITRKFSWIK